MKMFKRIIAFTLFGFFLAGSILGQGKAEVDSSTSKTVDPAETPERAAGAEKEEARAFTSPVAPESGDLSPPSDSHEPGPDALGDDAKNSPTSSDPEDVREAPVVEEEEGRPEDQSEEEESLSDILAHLDREVREAIGEAFRESRKRMRKSRRDLRRTRKEAGENIRESRRRVLEALRRSRSGALETARKSVRSLGKELERLGKRRGIDLPGVVDGDLTITGANESIRVGLVRGDASIVTYAGGIEIGEIGGSARLTAYSGDLVVGKVDGDLRAEAYGGDIEIGEASRKAILSVKGGDLRVGKSKGLLTAKVEGGEIRLHGIEASVEAFSVGGDIRGRVTQFLSQESVRLETKGGSIDLEIPKGMGIDLTIEFTVHRRAEGDRLLETNIKGLKRSVRDVGGDVRILYKGVLHGGGAKIDLSAFYGTITVMEREE